MCTINELADICTDITIERERGVAPTIKLEMPLDRIYRIKIVDFFPYNCCTSLSDNPPRDGGVSVSRRSGIYPWTPNSHSNLLYNPYTAGAANLAYYSPFTELVSESKSARTDVSRPYNPFNDSSDFIERVVPSIVDYVEDIRVYNDRVIVMKFKDGTYTKSECYGDDTFDINFGLTICVFKKIIGNYGKNKTYKKLLDKLVKLMKKKDNERQAKLLAKEKREQKRRDIIAKREMAEQQAIDDWRNNLTDCISKALEKNGLIGVIKNEENESNE